MPGPTLEELPPELELEIFLLLFRPLDSLAARRYASASNGARQRTKKRLGELYALWLAVKVLMRREGWAESRDSLALCTKLRLGGNQLNELELEVLERMHETNAVPALRRFTVYGHVEAGRSTTLSRCRAGSLARLRQLTFDGFHMGDDDMGAVATAMRAGAMPLLGRLAVSGGVGRACHFTAAGMRVLAEAIWQRGSLRWLDLRENNMSDACMAALVCRRPNDPKPKLVHLDVSYNNLSDEGGRSLLALVRELAPSVASFAVNPFNNCMEKLSYKDFYRAAGMKLHEPGGRELGVTAWDDEEAEEEAHGHRMFSSAGEETDSEADVERRALAHEI